ATGYYWDLASNRIIDVHDDGPFPAMSWRSEGLWLHSFVSGSLTTHAFILMPLPGYVERWFETSDGGALLLGPAGGEYWWLTDFGLRSTAPGSQGIPLPFVPVERRLAQVSASTLLLLATDKKLYSVPLDGSPPTLLR